MVCSSVTLVTNDKFSSIDYGINTFPLNRLLQILILDGLFCKGGDLYDGLHQSSLECLTSHMPQKNERDKERC